MGAQSQSGKRPSGPVNKQNVAYADLQSLYTDVLQKWVLSRAGHYPARADP